MKYQARCITAYETVISAGPMVDHHGNILCQLPEWRATYLAGKIGTFPTKAKRKAFMVHPNNAGKWEALS